MTRIPEKVMEATVEWLREDVEPDVTTRLRCAGYRDGEEKNITVGNMIASLHQHLTTRPLKEDKKPDCQIHMHVYFQNACWANHENRFQAVQFEPFVTAKGYYEAAWESRLADETARDRLRAGQGRQGPLGIDCRAGLGQRQVQPPPL